MISYRTVGVTAVTAFGFVGEILQFKCSTERFFLFVITLLSDWIFASLVPLRHTERQRQPTPQREQRRVQSEFGPGGVVQQRQQSCPAAHLLTLLPPEPPAAAPLSGPVHWFWQPWPEPDQEDGFPGKRGSFTATVPGRGHRSCGGL